MTAPQQPQWGTKARANVMFAVGLQVLLVCGIVVVGNWLAARRYKRWDWTDDVTYKLDEKTLNVLARLAEGEPKYQIVIFYAPDDFAPWEVVLTRTKDLLEEYRTRSSGKLKYEVVYLQSREGVLAAKKRHAIKSEVRGNDIIFKRNDSERIVNLKEFFGSSWEDIGPRGAPKLDRYDGERIVTSTLQALAQDKPVKLGFVKGHEEASPTGKQPRDWGFFASQILEKRESYTIVPVDLTAPNGVPTDLAALIIVSPHRDYGEQDIRALTLFMNAGGRLLVALDAGPENNDQDGKRFPQLVGFLSGYGIIPQGDIVFDPQNCLSRQVPGPSGTMVTFEDKPSIQIAHWEKDHLVTQKFNRDTIVVMLSAQSLLLDESKFKEEGFKVSELAGTGHGAWGERDFFSANKKQAQEPTENRDTPGPLTVAAAASGTPKGSARESRLVVLGDSTAMADEGFGAQVANPDLVLNSIRWLAEQEYIIGVEKKRPEDRSLKLTTKAENRIFNVSVFFIPMLAIGFGLTVWWARRNQ